MFDRISDEADDEHGHAFAKFQDDIADEAVTDDDIDRAFRYISPFYVTIERDSFQIFQHRIRLLAEFVALRRFLADVQQADRRLFDAQDVFCIMVSHDGPFDEVLRLAVGIGPGVEEHRNALLRRDRCRDTGPFDAFDTSQPEEGCRHSGASAASGDDSIAEAVFDQPRRYDDGCVFLAADGLSRMFAHFDDFAGVYDGQAVAFFGAIFAQYAAYFLFVTYQDDIKIICFDGLYGTEDDFFRCVITAHSIYSYFHSITAPLFQRFYDKFCPEYFFSHLPDRDPYVVFLIALAHDFGLGNQFVAYSDGLFIFYIGYGCNADRKVQYRPGQGTGLGIQALGAHDVRFVDHIVCCRHNRNGILADDAVHELPDDRGIAQFRLRRFCLLADADTHFGNSQGHAVQADSSHADGKFFSQFFIVYKRIFFNPLL